MKRRVAITGLGIWTGVGRGVEESWANLCAGRSGVSVVTVFDASALPVRIGGQVKNFETPHLECLFPEVIGERDRKIWLGIDALAQAVQDAGLGKEALVDAVLVIGVSLETFFLNDISPVVGSESLEAAFHQLINEPSAPRLQTPLDRLTQIAHARHRFGRGLYTNCSACAAGTQAIGEAFRRIRDGTVEMAVAGATDSVLNPLAMGGFSLLQILSAENETPTKACRPFDATRRGTVLGEGAAFVAMETVESAVSRHARIYAEVLGYGTAFDAYRVTDPEPNGKGAVLSMRRAMADAGLNPEQIDSINAHGTGTPKNDVAETRAIKTALGSRATQIPVTANKSMTGHLIAASGAVEAVASALTLFKEQVPPTLNLTNPDPECDLDYVPGECRTFTGRTVLSNSFGFGGQNATLILGKAPGAPTPSSACLQRHQCAGEGAGAPSEHAGAPS